MWGVEGGGVGVWRCEGVVGLGVEARGGERRSAVTVEGGCGEGGGFGRVDVRMRSVDARITRRLGSLRADGMRMGEVGSSH